MIKNLQLGIVALMTIFLSGNLFSQFPTEPVNLNADISYNGTDYVMLLSWQAGINHTLTDLFNVYIASANTENPGDFALSGTFTRDGNETAIYTFSHTFTVTDEYSVYIAGQNGLGEGPASAFLHFHTGPAIIGGRVVEDLYYLGPIAKADVTIKAIAPPDTTYYYYATTNDSGYFEFEVLDGNYKVFVGGDYCRDIWYQNAETEEQATEITAKYGYRTDILIDSFKEDWVNVKGNVKDKITGYPVYPATVDFMAFRDKKLLKTISVPTLSDGSYTISLSGKYSYKIIAYDNYVPNRYIPMYYYNTYDYLESEILPGSRLHMQPSPNFELEEYPNSLNEINGTVRDNLGNGVKSMLILYKHRVTSGVRTIESDDNGKFSFQKLEKGKYIIRALPYGHYTSGFFNKKDYVEPHWFDAALIEVDENTEFIDHLIVVNPITYPVGNYLIEGSVLGNPNAIEGKNEKVQDDVYIPGAVTYLLNSKMQTVAVDIWGFSFPNLASDHYTLKVDKIGYDFYTSEDVYVNEIDTAKFVKVYLNKHSHTNPTISFKTTPTTEAFVGQSYSYDANAVTNSIDSIRYDLIESPQGMTIDGISGLINWTPRIIGSFSVTIEAYLINNSAVTIQQTWEIEVKEGISTAFLSVLVKNASEVFPDATLKLYPTDFSSTFTVTTDSKGMAMYAVPVGEYYMQLSGALFETCWYNNQTELANADIITLTAGDTLEIEANVTEKITTYKLSGTVTDGTSSAIAQASVNFILETGEIRTLTTDAQGKFTFEIGKDTAFRAFAVKDGEYTAQFFPALYDFAEAQLIKNTNSSSFDFQLEQLPKSTVTIEGKILDESALPIPGVVVAYQVKEYDQTDFKFDVWFVNSTATKDGNYNITVPIGENYILRAYPSNLNYYPAYYSEEINPAYSWIDSKIIDVQSSAINNIFVRTEKVTPTSGTGTIYGKVAIYILVMLSNNYDQKSGYGFTVFAFDQQNKICKYTYTTSQFGGYEGDYSLSNLALSQWTVVSEKVGLYEQPSTKELVTLSQSLTSRVADLIYSFGGSVDEEAEKIMTVYPNPGGSIITLSFKEENVLESRISVIDNLGVERMSFVSNDNQVKIDVSSLPAGAYFIRISRGVKVYTMPFVKFRE